MPAKKKSGRSVFMVAMNKEKAAKKARTDDKREKDDDDDDDDEYLVEVEAEVPDASAACLSSSSDDEDAGVRDPESREQQRERREHLDPATQARLQRDREWHARARQHPSGEQLSLPLWLGAAAPEHGRSCSEEVAAEAEALLDVADEQAGYRQGFSPRPRSLPSRCRTLPLLARPRQSVGGLELLIGALQESPPHTLSQFS